MRPAVKARHEAANIRFFLAEAASVARDHLRYGMPLGEAVARHVEDRCREAEVDRLPLPAEEREAIEQMLAALAREAIDRFRVLDAIREARLVGEPLPITQLSLKLDGRRS